MASGSCGQMPNNIDSVKRPATSAIASPQAKRMAASLAPCLISSNPESLERYIVSQCISENF